MDHPSPRPAGAHPVSVAAPRGTAEPSAVLGLREAVLIIMGIVIGAGIFKAPSMVAGMTGSASWMFGAWLLGGLISLIGALCYAELATAYPSAGGDYHFLRRAYGRNVAFLFGWARFSVILVNISLVTTSPRTTDSFVYNMTGVVFSSGLRMYITPP